VDVVDWLGWVGLGWVGFASIDSIRFADMYLKDTRYACDFWEEHRLNVSAMLTRVRPRTSIPFRVSSIVKWADSMASNSS